MLQANGNGGASFALVTKNDYITLGANKAYLEIPPLGQAKPHSLEDIGSVSAAISEIIRKNNTETESIYNVSGVRTNNLRSGVHIVRYKNGKTKKVIY